MSLNHPGEQEGDDIMGSDDKLPNEYAPFFDPNFIATTAVKI